jgi:hypothetical protein
MKIDVYANGKLLYSITGTDDFKPEEVVIVTRKLIENATMTAEGFDDLFFEKLKDSRTHVEAYDKAEQKHFDTFGHNKYRDFDSFRVSKSKRLKND